MPSRAAHARLLAMPIVPGASKAVLAVIDNSLGLDLAVWLPDDQAPATLEAQASASAARTACVALHGVMAPIVD